jgi:hypothetical protein
MEIGDFLNISPQIKKITVYHGSHYQDVLNGIYIPVNSHTLLCKERCIVGNKTQANTRYNQNTRKSAE